MLSASQTIPKEFTTPSHWRHILFQIDPKETEWLGDRVGVYTVPYAVAFRRCIFSSSSTTSNLCLSDEVLSRC